MVLFKHLFGTVPKNCSVNAPRLQAERSRSYSASASFSLPCLYGGRPRIFASESIVSERWSGESVVHCGIWPGSNEGSKKAPGFEPTPADMTLHESCHGT